jgi:hypothetical protein
MAAGKYIDLVSGLLTQKASVDTSAGAGDAGKLVSLNAAGQIDATMIDGTYTGAIATTTIAAGDLVYITSTGTVELAKADALATLAQGFSIAGGTFPGNVTVQFSGENTGVAALTPGQVQYLSAGTAGKLVTSPPATPTQYVQKVGFAVTATDLHFHTLSPVVVV